MTKDAEVLKLLSGRNSLLDAKLITAQFRQSVQNTEIELEFQCRNSADFPYVSVKFTGVSSFHFYQSETEQLVDVCDLKFLQLRDGSFYISLDPDPATLPAAGVDTVEINDADCFYISALHIVATVFLPDT